MPNNKFTPAPGWCSPLEILDPSLIPTVFLKATQNVGHLEMRRNPIVVNTQFLEVQTK